MFVRRTKGQVHYNNIVIFPLMNIRGVMLQKGSGT